MSRHSVKQYCPPILPEIDLNGSSVNGLADAITYFYMINAMIKHAADAGWVPSRRWINYWAGINLAGLYSYLGTHGICNDNLWSSDDIFPRQEAVADAASHKLNIKRIKFALGDRTSIIEEHIYNQIPVIVHIARYRSFDKKNLSTSLTLPSPLKYNDPKDAQDPYIDESAFCIVEFDKRSQFFTAIGADGFFLIPYYYIEHPLLCTSYSH